ncbi:hypothetical protein ACFSO7_09450 [Bacillus sp. CGMCC 1.16607]|uniref:hypothetical protein n=1 Tax=Bacillus sp. CGMCC 1.16607 TaxID=3351842 RepID=UPI00362888FA
MAHEKFSNVQWRKEFEQYKLNVRVNKNLIKVLQESINCSLTTICTIIGDEGNSYLTRGKETANANYSKVRATADFLGVPPWLIFSEEGNENIKGLYENAEASVFKTYNISSNGDSIRKLKNGLSRATNLKQEMINKYKKVLDEINEVLSINGEYMEDSWEEILKFLKKEFKKDKVDWGCHISLNNGSFNGTLRITKWIELDKYDKTKIKDRFSSAWFYYKETDNNQPYEEELLIILNDVSKLIEKPFWQFSVSSNLNTKANLFSWHSNRVFDNEPYNKSKIMENLPLSPNFIASPEPVISVIHKFNLKEAGYINDDGDINEFIKWLEDTEISEVSSNISTSDNYLKLLLNENYLKENDRLIFKYENDFKKVNNKAVCTLVIHKGEPRVKWDYDDNIYSISSLSKQLLLESDRISPSTNPDGNKYWRLEGSNATSLFDVAVNIKRDIESGQLKLF